MNDRSMDQLHARLSGASPCSSWPYQCPRTCEQLDPRGGVFRSRYGKQSYPIRRGVPVFLRYKPIESKQELELMERLNKTAQHEGCRRAIEEMYGEQSGITRQATDQSRLNFLDLLPIEREHRILEIGPGLGQNAIALASRVHTVYALDPMEHLARFTLHRAHEARLGNVEVACGGDDCTLPYQDAVFNGVVFNFSLETCGARRSDLSASDAQQWMLWEIGRVLKPGGFLYVATENRYSIRRLVGGTDPHAHGLRFGNALPRWMMSLGMRMHGNRRPAGLLQSYQSLRFMLGDSGLESGREYCTLPSVAVNSRIVPLDPRSIAQARREGMFKGTGFLRWVPAAMVKHVAPGLAFLAIKSPEL